LASGVACEEGWETIGQVTDVNILLSTEETTYFVVIPKSVSSEEYNHGTTETSYLDYILTDTAN